MLFLPTKTIYPLFFISGAAGLIYEIVWSRLLVLIFGSTTNSLVAVIAAFLGGLAIGSLIFGKIADNLRPAKLIKTYSFLELGVGVTAALTLLAVPIIKNTYALFSDGSTVTFNLLIIKFILAIFVLIIPTTLMGATLPILVRFAESQNNSLKRSVSLLYATNTFGAVAGVLISAFLLIELIGLKNSILVAVFLNITVAILALRIKSKDKTKIFKNKTDSSFSAILLPNNIFVISAFSISGLVSIAYEILWTRILTPTVGTFIYAFAAILAIYLFGIALGSLIYEKFSKIIKANNLTFATCEFGIGFFALGSIYLVSNQAAFLNRNLMVLMVLLPATIFMGLTFPAAVALLKSKGNSGKIVGLSYFGNTAGSITGGFLASFFFLPLIGSTQSVIFLSLINFTIAALFVLKETKIPFSFKFKATSTILILIIFTSWLLIFKRHSLYENTTQWRINWAKAGGIDFVFKEDEVASVFGYRNPKNNDHNLFIDGVPTTGKIGETKLMAHIPILLHPNPQNVLVIAFGMGTTYRSSLSYDLKTDAVELVPSVPPMMYLFHDDAEKIQKNASGRIIINDGRNYVFLTKKTYDVITIDPPPPFNAAGTTVLYSREFYQEITKKLNPKGIVGQWIFFGSREDDIAMAIKSFVEVFPYVLVFQSPDGAGGVFLEGSFSPFVIDKTSLEQKFNNKKASEDLEEFYKDLRLTELLDLAIGNRDNLSRVVGHHPAITDDRPRTEYFKLRHKFTKSPDLPKGDWGKEFIERIKSKNLSD